MNPGLVGGFISPIWVVTSAAPQAPHITGLPATFPLLGLFCVVCFGLFCLCVFVLWFCLVFRFLFCDGIVTALDYVSVHHQFTFAAPHEQTAIFASIN